MDNQIFTVEIKELKETPGKPIYLTFDNKKYKLLTDKRCLGNLDYDNICINCRLKFKCYSGDALNVNVDKDLSKVRFNGIQEPTINELLDSFLAMNGVDLQKIAARAKIIEDGEADENNQD